MLDVKAIAVSTPHGELPNPVITLRTLACPLLLIFLLISSTVSVRSLLLLES